MRQHERSGCLFSPKMVTDDKDENESGDSIRKPRENEFEDGFKTSDPNSFICKDQEEVNLLIRRKETEETTRYISYFYRKSFGQTNIHAKGHKTYWQDKNILYSGVPYIIVSQKVLDCRHGKDHNKKAKQKYHATKDNKTRKDHVHRKTYNIVQATKKVDCPAKVIVKEIIFFPHFKIQANTPQKRRYSAKLLQESLKSKAMNEFERRFVCIFPDIKDHKAHPVVGQEAGTSPQGIDKLLDPADAPPGCSYAPDPEGHTENLTQPAPPPPKRFSSHATHIRELLNQCKELSYLIEHREHLCIEVLDALKVVKEAMSEGIEKETGVALEKMTRLSKEGPSI